MLTIKNIKGVTGWILEHDTIGFHGTRLRRSTGATHAKCQEYCKHGIIPAETKGIMELDDTGNSINMVSTSRSIYVAYSNYAKPAAEDRRGAIFVCVMYRGSYADAQKKARNNPLTSNHLHQEICGLSIPNANIIGYRLVARNNRFDGSIVLNPNFQANFTAPLGMDPHNNTRLRYILSDHNTDIPDDIAW